MCEGLPLAIRLRSQAQNNEMVDSSYTLSGRLMNEAADSLELLEGRLSDQESDMVKYRAFLTDEARSTWACEKCGHRKSAYGCLWCKIKALQARTRDLESVIKTLERERAEWTQR